MQGICQKDTPCIVSIPGNYIGSSSQNAVLAAEGVNENIVAYSQNDEQSNTVCNKHLGTPVNYRTNIFNKNTSQIQRGNIHNIYAKLTTEIFIRAP